MDDGGGDIDSATDIIGPLPVNIGKSASNMVKDIDLWINYLSLRCGYITLLFYSLRQII